MVKKLEKLQEKFAGELNDVQTRPVLHLLILLVVRMVAKIESVCYTLQVLQKGIHDIYTDGVVEGFSQKSGTQHVQSGPSFGHCPRHEDDLKTQYDKATKEPEPHLFT